MAVAAAACLLCAVAIGWRLGELRKDHLGLARGANESPLAAFALIHELPDRAAVGFDSWAATAESTSQSARLSADVRLTAEALMERLPVDLELASE